MSFKWVCNFQIVNSMLPFNTETCHQNFFFFMQNKLFLLKIIIKKKIKIMPLHVFIFYSLAHCLQHVFIEFLYGTGRQLQKDKFFFFFQELATFIYQNTHFIFPMAVYCSTHNYFICITDWMHRTCGPGTSSFKVAEMYI